jgi:hypothetical protein
MVRFIGTSLQLQSITTAHNQRLPKTHSIPYWTTNVFFSAVTDLALIYESATSKSKKKVKVMLRSTLSRPTCLCVKHPSYNKIFIVRQLRSVDVGRSIWRENGSAVYNWGWSSPVQSLLGPSPILLSQIRDSPNLEGQVPVFTTPRNRVHRLYPYALRPLNTKFLLNNTFSSSGIA